MTSLRMIAIGGSRRKMQSCKVAIRRLLGGCGSTTKKIDSSGTEYHV